jgi:hypothetical protein
MTSHVRGIISQFQRTVRARQVRNAPHLIRLDISCLHQTGQDVVVVYLCCTALECI